MKSYEIIEMVRRKTGLKNDLAICKETGIGSGRMSNFKAGKMHLNPLEIDKLADMMNMSKADRYDLVISIERERESRKGFIERAALMPAALALAIFSSGMMAPSEAAASDRGSKTTSSAIFAPTAPTSPAAPA